MGNCFGFGYEGVEGGSCAARFQSCCFGGEIPAGGWFARCQSRGAKGEGPSKMTICCAVFLNILGILLIAGGVVLGYYPEKLDPILFYVEDVTDHEFLPVYQLAIAIGVFLCISATIACCCDKCSGIFLLIAFIMIIVVIGILSHSVQGYDSDKLESDIKKNMLGEINSTDAVLDFIQQKLECCGVEGPSDWQRNSNFDNKTVPDSCCEVEVPNCGKNFRPDDIFHGGCLINIMEKITIYFRWQIGFVAIFSLIAALAICFSCCLACGC